MSPRVNNNNNNNMAGLLSGAAAAVWCSIRGESDGGGGAVRLPRHDGSDPGHRHR